MNGYGSYVVNGDRTALQTRAAYAPQSYGPSLASVPVSGPNIPPALGAASVASGVYGQAETPAGYVDIVGNYGTADNNGLATAIAAGNPWSFRDSPVLPALLFLVLGLVGLRIIHWRKG